MPLERMLSEIFFVEKYPPPPPPRTIYPGSMTAQPGSRISYLTCTVLHSTRLNM